MTTNTIRQKIAENIHFVDEKKAKPIYSLLEESINQKNGIWANEFSLEMQKRANDIETNKIKTKTKTQVFAKAKSVVNKINNAR